MASMFRRTLLYLGLAPDSEYEDFGTTDEASAPVAPARTAAAQAPVRQPASASAQDQDGANAVRTITPTKPTVAGGAGVPASRADSDPRSVRPSVVRPLPVARSTRPHKCAPTSFDDAQLIADRYKNSQAVIVNLQGVEQALARRIIDFASGLCYGIGGQMERVANHVYLLTPADVEVSADVRADLDDRGE